MKVSKLEVKPINDARVELEELNSRVDAMIDCQSDIVRSYYEIKMFLEVYNYQHSFNTIFMEYRSYLKGDNISCSGENIIRNCHKEIKTLYDEGYRE